MKKLTGNQIIRMYIDFFKERGHTEVESASLIPHNDPTILWINAGVTPLKKYFDGSVVPKNKRLTSCQKCIRTGDIESVGKTARHHTFFQMLGNFSIEMRLLLGLMTYLLIRNILILIKINFM